MTEPFLGPKAIANRLFIIDPDRDERASQLCTEALLLLAANGYEAPDQGELRGPKLRRFAARSLILGRNFLEGYNQSVRSGAMSAREYGDYLMRAEDFHGADNLALARTALRNLVDPSTEQGQSTQHLMLPFHESLLWYDARQSNGQHTVRKVRMRGSGITLARMLLSPPSEAEEAVPLGQRAVAGIRSALTSSSPLSEIASALEEVLPEEARAPVRVEEDEVRAWELGGETGLSDLAVSICRHAEGIMLQGEASGPSKLWQLRTILALDLAINALRRAWQFVEAPVVGRHILLAMPGTNRSDDRVRLRSERSYESARMAIRWATIHMIAEVMREHASAGNVDWASGFDGRTARVLSESVIEPLQRDGSRSDFRELAQLAFENANYDRSGEGFRVLLESVGMSAGGTRYRYLSATPDLLASLVGALSAEMPMTSGDFFRRLRDEWGLVISPDAALGTDLRNELDGASLAVNARRFERVMIDAGLASGLSDRTVMVGERAGRRVQ